ncbi:MAG: MMPL family transporter [Paludibacteraceae bacterium]|nr:MMPL family transporter [Paludibacteraceae bacterium]
MYTFFEFLRKRRIVFWGVVFLIVVGLSSLASRCVFEENIFKLLPEPEGEAQEDFRVTFTDLKLKDKIFIQAVPRTPEEGETDYEAPDAETLAAALDLFMDSLTAATEERHSILYTLSYIDPSMLMDVASYAMVHMPEYVDADAALLDSLCSPEHVRYQLEQYMALMETDMGENLYDLMTYDPCGIALGAVKQKLPAGLLDGVMENSDRPSRFQYGHLYAPDAQACLGFITPNFGTDNSREASKLVATMREVREHVRATYPDVDILMHGAIVVAGGNSNRMRTDIYWTVGIAMGIIFILMALTLKRPSYLMITVMALVFGVITALAGVYLAQTSLSLMSLGIGCIVIGVAFSYVLHVLIHYLYTGSIEDTLKEQSKPVLVGALTTIGAFAGLLFTNSPLLNDFGLFALLMIAGTTVLSLIVAPHLLPRRFTPNKKAFTVLEKMNAYHIDRNKPIVIITVLWVAVCICFSGQYKFDNDLRHISYLEPESVYAQNHWNSLMNEGFNQQYYASVAHSYDEALEQLPSIEQAVDSLRAIGLVEKGLNRSWLMPSLSKQQERLDAWQAYFTPAKRKQVWHTICAECNRLSIDPSLFDNFQELMANPAEPELIVETDILPPEVLENFVEQKSGLYLVYFSVKNLPENTLAVNDCLTKVDGCMLMNPYYYCKNLVELIHDDFNLIMWISMGFVLLLLLITYRNIWLTLIALLPMLLSWYTVLGAMALFGQTFNLVNIIVSSFVFGIGVDYSVFIMEGLRKGDDDNPTMVYNKTAITMSATILVICMFVLGFAVHPAVSSISFASTVGMITTIMLSYTIEPILYRFYMKVKNRKKKVKV